MSELVRLHDLPDGRSNDAWDALRPYLHVPLWAHRVWHCLWFDSDTTSGVGAGTLGIALEVCALSQDPDAAANAICAAHRLGGDVRALLTRMTEEKEENDESEASGV